MQERIKTKNAAGKADRAGEGRGSSAKIPLRASAKNAVRGKRIALALLCFFAALLFAGTRAFPGTYPFGIALAASAGGVLSAVSVTLGSLVGSARIPAVGGVYALAFASLFVLRLVLSRWLAESSSRPKPRGKPEDGGPLFSALLPKLRRFISLLLDEADEGRQSRYSAPAVTDPSRSPLSVTQGGDVPGSGKMNVGTVLREHIRIRMALSACAALFAGAWSVVAGGYETVDLFGAVFSVLVTPLFTYLFYAASERNMRVSFFREFGVLAVLAVTAMALTEISSSLFALPLRASGTIEALTGEGAVLRRKTLFDVGAFFTLSASLLLARDHGWHRGALAGLCCGVVTVPALSPMYPLSAAAYALLDALRLPSVFPVVGAGVVSVAWGIFTGGVDGFTRVLPPAAVTCAVLVPLFRGDLLKTPRDLFGLSESPAGTARFGRTGDAYGTEIRAGRTENRVDSLSEGLLSVSALLRGLASRLSKPAPAELRAAVERCFENRCSRCSGREECRRKRLSRTEPLIRAMTDSLARRGSVSSALIPPSLASRCPEMGGILDDVNREAGEKLVSPGWEDPLSSAASDWELAGELLSSAARSGRDAFREDPDAEKKLRRLLSQSGFGAESVRVWGSRERRILVGGVDLLSTRMGADDIRRLFESSVRQPLSAPEFEIDGPTVWMRMRSVSVFSCKTGSFSCAASSVHKYWCESRGCGADSGERDPEKTGETEAEASGEKPRVTLTDEEPGEISGDVITDFEAGGKQYMILSDGMGSGREAALSAGMAVSLLERLITAGAGTETALKILNRVLRATGRECSATVDVAEIDLYTGEARFVKSGAAPSFVLRDGSIFRLQSKTVPVGILRALDAEMIRFDVRAGDTVVMVSDGAARSYDEDPWLLDLLSSDEGILRGDERSAAAAVVGEAAQRGGRDDITCGIVRVVRR